MKPLPTEALDVDDPGKRVGRTRTVLVFADLPADVRRRLKDRGAAITDAESVLGTVALLADREFDAAIFDMTLSAELVKRLKGDIGTIEDVPEALCAKAAERCRLMPFFLVTDGQPQFAVVISPPEHAYVDTGDLVEQVMTIDVVRVINRGAARA